MHASPLADTAIVIVVGLVAFALLDALAPSLPHDVAVVIAVVAAYAVVRVLDRWRTGHLSGGLRG